MRSFVIALCTALLLAACAEGADDVAVTTTEPSVDLSASTTSTSPVETTTTTVATTTTEPTTTTIAGVLIEVVVAGGEVTVEGGTSVALGEQVTIRVTSDVADVVQVEAYDVSADLAADTPGDLAFTAEEAGTFAVALQESGTTLFDLEVTE